MTMRIEAFANPDVLRWARMMSGLTHEEVARKAGVKPERLRMWEEDVSRPTIRQLQKLSDIYRRPLAVFYFDTPPADDPTPRDFRRFDPEASEPLSPSLRLVIRDARVRRQAAIDLQDELDDSPTQFGLNANLSENPEEVGERLRNALESGTSPPTADSRQVFNFWRSTAERIGTLVFQAENVDVEEMRGLSISERPFPSVVLNIKDVYPARSFSLLHELTHLMLNHGGLCIFEEQGPHTDLQRTEVFCNHVAGATLLPASLLLQEPEVPLRRVRELPDQEVSDLARRYGASREAVLRRLVILDRIPIAFYQRKRREFAREFALRRQQPRKGGFAPPYTMAVARSGQRFTRLVLEAYDEERITASDVAEHLRIRLKHLDRIRAAVLHEPSDGGHS